MYKTFIIHLSKIKSSLESALQLQKDLTSINIDAELFEGTYGSDAEEIFKKESRQVHPTSFKGEAVDERYTNKTKRPGVMGCFYSHYRLWQKCVELNETICVFEDDVAIHRPLISVPFDDVLILTLGARKSEKYKQYLHNPSGDPIAEDYHNASMPGTTGYAITPQGAKKLLTVYNKTFLASDNAMNVMVVDIKIHNYLVGTANLEKKSLTRSTEFWNKFKNA
jgi:GR25 family glycosyltransferase involved in LPS biosynthesis